MQYFWLAVTSLLVLSGCYTVGYKDYIDFKNNMVGKTSRIKPFTFKDAGQFNRGDFQITGQGITHVTKSQNGDLVVHWFSSEILPHFYKKEWIGKCLIYYVVDQKTHIIKSWGFDKGGNPLSCRTWP